MIKNILLAIGSLITLVIIELLFSGIWGWMLAFVIPLKFWKIGICIFVTLEISRAIAVVVKGLGALEKK